MPSDDPFERETMWSLSAGAVVPIPAAWVLHVVDPPEHEIHCALRLRATHIKHTTQNTRLRFIVYAPNSFFECHRSRHERDRTSPRTAAGGSETNGKIWDQRMRAGGQTRRWRIA